MVQVQQRVLIAVVLCAAAAVLAPATNAPKFYPDDPLMTMPAPRDVGKPNSRKLSEYFDYFHHTLNTPGDLNTEVKQTPALSTNSIDEVPDSGWYVNRHYRRRMSRDALR